MATIDLGHGVDMRWVQWSPDRDLNPQYDGIPDDPRNFMSPAKGGCGLHGFIRGGRWVPA